MGRVGIMLAQGAASVVLALAAAPRPAVSMPLALHECRLEHPLRLTSIAARCGVLSVPEDRARPDGARIDLAIAVVPSLNRRSAAPPVFILAGGPGQGAIGMYTGLAGAFARVNRSHDIVLVDQRGTGASAPLNCDYPEDWLAPADPLPELRRLTLECLHRYGDRVRFYTTGAAVQDLEQVRLGLGVSRIDLYGVSYGTRVAQLYMRRFPQAVHAAILDGVTYPEQAIGPDTPEDGEHALSLIVARCGASPDCAKAYPNLAQELSELRHQFGGQKTLLTIEDPESGRPLKVEFNRTLLNVSLRFLSYNSGQASLLPALIHQATLDGPSALAAQTVMMGRRINDQLSSGMQNTVICSEDVPYFPAQLDRAALERTYQGSDQLDAFEEVCKLWPHGAVDADLHSPLHSEVPTLLLSGEADPVTPPADADRAARGFDHHRHLVLPGEGHGQVASGCVPKLMAAFFDSAAPEQLDAGCLKLEQPASFFVNGTGPAP